MKIIPNQRFKHDKETYEKDQEYDVSDELAHYFKNVGWTGEKASGADATLEVHSSAIGHKAKIK